MELTSLEPRRKGLTQLYLDGEPGPKLDTEVVLLARLQPGDVLSEEELQELVERSDARRAQEKALYLLEHRSHSKRELTEKIARTAASREAAQAAADHLEEIGLVDDRAFAETYARELFQRKRYGARRVRQELSRKGIGPGHHRPGAGAVPGHGPGRRGEHRPGAGAALSHLAGGRKGPPPGGGGLAAAGVLLRAGARRHGRAGYGISGKPGGSPASFL